MSLQQLLGEGAFLSDARHQINENFAKILTLYHQGSVPPLFVDGVNGSDSALANDGSDPEHAYASVGRALSKASAFGTVYVLDKGISGTDPDPYREAAANLDIPYAKNNLALVGVPHNMHDTYGLQIKAAAGLTTPILTIRAPLVAVENLDFNGTGDALARGNIVFKDDGDTVNQAQGGSVYNCHIRNGKGLAGASGIGGGVVFQGGWYYTVKNCHFERCRCGVQLASAGATVMGVRIEDNLFTSADLDLVDFDIYLGAGGGTVIYSTSILRNMFAHAKGNYAGAASKYVHLLADGALSDNHFASTGLTWGATAKTGGDVPVTFFMTGNYDETGLCART